MCSLRVDVQYRRDPGRACESGGWRWILCVHRKPCWPQAGDVSSHLHLRVHIKNRAWDIVVISLVGLNTAHSKETPGKGTGSTSAAGTSSQRMKMMQENVLT